MSSTNVISICQPPRTFSEAEVNTLIPLLERITARHENAVSKLLDNQRFLLISGASKETVNKIDPQVGKHMVDWGQKIVKLGGRVFQHGYVGFDGGGFYYSWHYGEAMITHFHMYNESPFDRKPIKVDSYVQKT